jgi:hypothetical protein
MPNCQDIHSPATTQTEIPKPKVVMIGSIERLYSAQVVYGSTLGRVVIVWVGTVGTL